MMFTGRIKFYSGPMFGGKSNALMNDYIRHSLAKKKCILIKYSEDNRYNGHITHDSNYSVSDNKIIYKNIILNDFTCSYLMDADKIVNDYDVIFVDEIQFFKDNYIFCEKWANQGKEIVLAGLMSTFERKLFNGMEKLIPLIEYIDINPAVCIETGNDACFTTRTIDDNKETIIGNDDIYKAVDRKTYYENDKIKINNYINMVKEFNKIYCEKNKIENIIDDEKIKKYIIEHDYDFSLIDCVLNC